MVLGAEEHTANEVGGRDTRGALNNLESAGGLDESVAVVSIAVGCNIVAVNNVFAAVVGDPGQVGHIGSMGDTLSSPATSIDSRDTGRIEK
jgi:hypothetical protein